MDHPTPPAFSLLPTLQPRADVTLPPLKLVLGGMFPGAAPRQLGYLGNPRGLELDSDRLLAEPHGSYRKKRRLNLPKATTGILLEWLQRNLDHPYPLNSEKTVLMQQTGLNAQQLGNWFINARRRKVSVLKGGDVEV